MNAQLKDIDTSSLPVLEDPTESMPEVWEDDSDFENDVDTYWDRELADELA